MASLACSHIISSLLIIVLSANGGPFPYYRNGTRRPSHGTSLSAPLFASVITLINEERTAIGKGPVGFINPVLYASQYSPFPNTLCCHFAAVGTTSRPCSPSILPHVRLVCSVEGYLLSHTDHRCRPACPQRHHEWSKPQLRFLRLSGSARLGPGHRPWYAELPKDAEAVLESAMSDAVGKMVR